MIVLYHGTNVEFHAPDVDAGRSGMDFGKGFYLTPNLESAKFMAKRVKRLKNAGEEIVLKFAFDEKAAAGSGIKAKMFPRIDLERNMSSCGCRRLNIKRCSIRFIRKISPTSF